MMKSNSLDTDLEETWFRSGILSGKWKQCTSKE